MVTAAAHAAVPVNYGLVWSDEFNGTALDTNSWRFWTKQANNNSELQAFTQNRPQNHSVSGGALHITAHKEDYTVGGVTYHYTSAQIVSKPVRSYTYGYYEISAKLPVGAGYWPAIWLWPVKGEAVNVPWPRDGEIDIMEASGRNPRQIHSTAHYGDDSDAKSGKSGKTYNITTDLSQGFHKYALKWTPTELVWYLDDTAYFTVTDWSGSDNREPMPSPFDKPFSIMLDLAVGGSIGGTPSPSTVFPQSLSIDYVRVYQASVPEPSSILVLTLAGAGAALRRRSHREAGKRRYRRVG